MEKDRVKFELLEKELDRLKKIIILPITIAVAVIVGGPIIIALTSIPIALGVIFMASILIYPVVSVNHIIHEHNKIKRFISYEKSERIVIPFLEQLNYRVRNNNHDHNYSDKIFFKKEAEEKSTKDYIARKTAIAKYKGYDYIDELKTDNNGDKPKSLIKKY